MRVILPFTPKLSTYNLGPEHPLKPERFMLAVSLMRAYGLLAEENPSAAIPNKATVVEPDEVMREDLELVHDPGYIDVVMQASTDPDYFQSARGIGPGDTPAATGLHEASLIVCGATARAVREVVAGHTDRAFAVAGGLHHAHHDRAAGFCVYNDPAVAIRMALRDNPELRVMYVDIDAHHGDGVEEAFERDANVLTLSVHESGMYLYPGTGRVGDIGKGAGKGTAINVPLPPYADDACYASVAEQVITPAARAFNPDLIVAQCGADAHRDDPLTHLGLTLTGYRDLIRSLIGTAEECTQGRIVCTGGGGYGTYSVVPRAWTLVMAELLDTELDRSLPEVWRKEVNRLTGGPIVDSLLDEEPWDSPIADDELLAETQIVLERVYGASPLLGG